MPSPQSKALSDVYGNVKKFIGLAGLDPALLRVLLEDVASVAAEPKGVIYEEILCPGTVRPAIWCLPQESSPERVILFLHGGGFAAGSPSSHRKLAAHLAQKAKARALVIDYRRAPEFQFPKQIEDVISAYNWLIKEKGIPNTNIAFAGDSAGGNLVIAACLAAKQQGIGLPAAIVAFSPFLDMRLTGQSYKRNADTDALTVSGSVQSAVDIYVGSASLDERLLDLLNADLKGLPPMFLASGTAETLQDDAVMMAEKARAARLEVHLELGQDMQHVWVFMAGNAPEADECLSKAANFVESKFRK